MNEKLNFFIDGAWVAPASSRKREVINPASEKAIAVITLGSEQDVDNAVDAARNAFASYSSLPPSERLALLKQLKEIYERRMSELAEVITLEMGSPITRSKSAQAPSGLDHLVETIEALGSYQFEEPHGSYTILREPIGVCALITPWNWPANQIMAKLVPALAVGCTVILKPSEMAPLSGILITEMIEEAGFPPGVFNLIHGDGAVVGNALSRHPGVDMVSFTGSTTAGIAVAKNAADTVKRVSQELGGKSPNIILDDDGLAKAVENGALRCFGNSGQTCTAPTRMLVPASRLEEAVAIAVGVADRLIVGDPQSPDTEIGPLANAAQYAKVRSLIETGSKEGAILATGGPDRPTNTTEGYFVRPTVFSHVRSNMTIAREEIFGPVLSIIPYDNENEAVSIANDSVYGLSAAVSAEDHLKAAKIARRIRAGMVHINGAPLDAGAPFGGYKHSGNGREQGRHGLEDFLETKAVFGL